jgi:heterodisulfide reductase subunit A-like polyferredoxin
MFPDRPTKIDELPSKTLFLIAAGLVILCQLIASLLVAGHVKNVQVRDAPRMAISACSPGSVQAAHQRCIDQANAANAFVQDVQHSQPHGYVHADDGSELHTLAANFTQGWVPASFTTPQ